MAMSVLTQRKGVFFTIMALLVITFLLTTERVAVTPLTVNLADTMAAQSRVTVMNSYADTFETQASNSLATAGYFTLQNLSVEVARNGYIPNINTSIDNCIRIQPQNCMKQEVRFNTTMAKLIDIASSNLTIDTAYAVERVWVSEERPFEVVFWMNISYNISDPFANWTFQSRTIRADVDVSDIQDPTYARANTTGLLQLSSARVFKRTAFKRSQFTNATFYSLYNGREYIANPGPTSASYSYGPSVLQRYAGNITNSSACCGIESVVHWDEMNITRVSPYLVNVSFVDYLFFSPVRFNCNDITTTGISRLNATSMPGVHSNIRIDNDHLTGIYLNMSDHRKQSCSYP